MCVFPFTQGGFFSLHASDTEFMKDKFINLFNAINRTYHNSLIYRERDQRYQRYQRDQFEVQN